MTGRVPPQNLEAEESLLGAMLLHRDAIRSALDRVAAEDFWKPENSAIFAAVVECFHEGVNVDPTTVGEKLRVGGKLDEVGGRARLLRLQAATPASANAPHYAAVVGDLGFLRRALGETDDLTGLIYDGQDVAEVVARLSTVVDRLRPPLPPIEALDLDALAALADADTAQPAKPWIIPALFRSLETAIVTGGEGWGKSLLLRQIGVCVASALHPFTGLHAGCGDPLRVLYVDLQEDDVDMAHELRGLRRTAGAAYSPQMFHAVSRPQGMNILRAHDRRWLEGLLGRYQPALLLMGPVVRMFRSGERRSRNDEDLVDDVTDVLDDLKARYGLGIILEGHAGNVRDGDDAWRVRGSSVWRSWPRFGLGLKPVRAADDQGRRVVELVHWRGPGYAGRPWPKKLYSGGVWPWMPSDLDHEKVLRAQGLDELVDGADQPEIF